jgi:high-affinity nickel-transport protein
MGLGFDTATQVALLVLAGGTAAFALPWYAIMVLPVLFAAGMTLFDTIDGVFMAHAYKWAFLKPIRKIYYNFTVTILSVTVALSIGIILLVQLAAEELRVPALAWVSSVDLEYVGFALVGLFVAVWAASIGTFHLARIEERFEESA